MNFKVISFLLLVVMTVAIVAPMAQAGRIERTTCSGNRPGSEDCFDCCRNWNMKPRDDLSRSEGDCVCEDYA